MKSPAHPSTAFPSIVLALTGLLAACEVQEVDADPYTLEGYRAGDLFVLEDGTAVEIPEPGVTLEITDDYEDGAQTQRIETRPDGTVIYQPPVFEAPPEDEDAFRVSGDDCQYTGYTTNLPFSGIYDYYINPGDKPLSVGMLEFVEAVWAAEAAIEHQHNNCGLPDLVDTPMTYLGISVLEGPAGAHNGANTIGWSENLPASTLARAWTWSSGGVAIEGDIAFSTQHQWYGEHNPPGGCTQHYSLRGVGTHELGHVFGLGHASGPTQTMFPSTPPCTTRWISLSPGDIYGFWALY